MSSDSSENDSEFQVHQISPTVILLTGEVCNAMHRQFFRILRKTCKSELLLQAPDTVVEVFINSEGGDFGAGMAIGDLIAAAPAYIRTVVNGAAYSAATFIAVSANYECTITPNSHMMIHQMSTRFDGTAQQVQDESTNSTKLMRTMQELYKRQCPLLPVEKLQFLLTRDLILSAEECVQLGICSRLYDAW
jgi:ATP-dependent protease ClpP protease subunit